MRWLSVLVAALLAACLCGREALRAPRFLDDHAQLAMLEGRYPVARASLDLFSFSRTPRDHHALVDAGVLPWWSSPRWSLAMFRPLPSALSALDRVLFARGTVGPHLHSLAWLVALLVAASRLLAALLPSRAAALALSLFALSGASVIPLEWLAGRNALVAACLACWALSAALRFLRDARARHAAEALAAFTLAALAGEYALCALGPLTLFALTAPERSVRQRLAALSLASPMLAVALLARSLGYGAHNATAYLDPLASPARWLRDAPPRALALLDWLFAARPIDAPPSLALALVVALHLAAFALALRALPTRERAPLAAFVVGALLALLPLLSAPPSSRLLLLPSLAVASLVALAAHVALGDALAPSARWALRALVAPLVVLHALVAPLEARRESSGVLALFAAAQTSQRDLARVAGPDTNVLIRTASLDALHHAPFAFVELGQRAPTRWRVLTSGVGPVLAVRTAADTLELRSLQGPLVSAAGELYRARDEGFGLGETITVAGMQVTILELSQGLPTRIAVRFDRNLDDPSLRWIAHAQGAVVHARIPALHGGAVLE